MADRPRVAWGRVGSQLVGVLKEGLGDLLEGVEEGFDKDGFVWELADIVKDAARTGDAALLAEAKENLPWIAEFYRVTAVNAQWDAIGKVLDIAQGTLTTALAAVIPG